MFKYLGTGNYNYWNFNFCVLGGLKKFIPNLFCFRSCNISLIVSKLLPWSNLSMVLKILNDHSNTHNSFFRAISSHKNISHARTLYLTLLHFILCFTFPLSFFFCKNSLLVFYKSKKALAVNQNLLFHYHWVHSIIVY